MSSRSLNAIPHTAPTRGTAATIISAAVERHSSRGVGSGSRATVGRTGVRYGSIRAGR